MRSRSLHIAILICAGVFYLLSPAISQQGATSESIDYLTFSRGALPLGVSGSTESLRVTMSQAISAIDGNPGKYIVTPKPGDKSSIIELLYELPAPTTFERFVVSDIQETPSPSQTFVARIEVLGSALDSQQEFVSIGSATLENHQGKGELTEFAATPIPVRWIKIRLSGGIQLERDKTYFEFSEIMGYGSQQQVPMSESFTGIWKGRGVLIEMQQSGSLVSGCYDKVGDLNGAVSGRVLTATGRNRNSDVMSAFVLTVTPDGELRGLRSTNGAPFKEYSGGVGPEGTVTECSEPPETALGCGDIVYGLNFAYDSDTILEESQMVVDELYNGLAEETAAHITIEGHTSSEGSDAYNQDLSERRAASVVAQLVSRGIAESRISASGRGESEPIADNSDEAGRSLNRRVEVECAQ